MINDPLFIPFIAVVLALIIAVILFSLVPLKYQPARRNILPFEPRYSGPGATDISTLD